MSILAEGLGHKTPNTFNYPIPYRRLSYACATGLGTAVESLATEDAAATLTAFTAARIAGVLPLLPSRPALAIVCGGGARNKTLMRELADRLPCPVVLAETFGWSSDAI